MLYKHNIPLYESIVHSLDEDDVYDLLYVQGTGVGKSYVLFELIYNRFQGCNILYVVPKYAIQENLIAYKEYEDLPAIFEFITYDQFNKPMKDKCLQYDVIVFDEAHHIGSPLRSGNIEEVREAFKEAGKYFIGMTATPIRSDGINIAELFTRVHYGYTIFQCIEENLMPPVEYYIGCKLRSTRHIDFELSYDEISAAIKLYQRNKWLIFFDSIEQLEKHRDLVSRLFPKYKQIVVHSKCSGIKQLLQNVRTSKQCVVLTVNQLLEGIHIDDIEGVLLLRKVQSMLVFQQMIGRITRIGATFSPIFLDCTGTAYQLLTSLMSYNYSKSYNSKSVDELNVNTLNELAIMRRYPKRRKTVRLHLNNLRKYDVTKLFEKLETKYVNYQGKWYISLTECCKELSISAQRVSSRVSKGMSLEDAINEVIKATRFTYRGIEYLNLKDCLKSHNLDYEEYLKIKTSAYTPEVVIDILLYERGATFKVHGKTYASIFAYCYETDMDLNIYLSHKLIGGLK